MDHVAPRDSKDGKNRKINGLISKLIARDVKLFLIFHTRKILTRVLLKVSGKVINGLNAPWSINFHSGRPDFATSSKELPSSSFRAEKDYYNIIIFTIQDSLTQLLRSSSVEPQLHLHVISAIELEFLKCLSYRYQFSVSILLDQAFRFHPPSFSSPHFQFAPRDFLRVRSFVRRPMVPTRLARLFPLCQQYQSTTLRRLIPPRSWFGPATESASSRWSPGFSRSSD